MRILTQLQQQLQQQLLSLHPAKGIITLEADAPADLKTDNGSLLAWLQAQAHFPHFFWQSRDEQTTLASIGVVRHFDSLDTAETFSQTHNLSLFGGLKFEGQCHFLLPRLSLILQGNQLTACLYLDGVDFHNEKTECERLLANFAQLAEHQALASKVLTSQPANDFNRWQQLITQALEQIEQQHFLKVVLANSTTFQLNQPLNPYDLLYASQQKNRGCYHFLWSETGEQTFIGSSPERLYQRQHNQLQTEALAGTVAMSVDPNETEKNAEWLLNDQKNRYENQLVVDDICQHLSDCSERIDVSQAEIKRLPNVQHLRRHIQAMLHHEMHDSDILSRIQPTAAVAGLPRHHALPFIAEHEGFERGWYAGALGYIQPDQAEFCVALRSAIIFQNSIQLYAGAGIVEGSTADAEWQEINRKLQGLKSLLGEWLFV